MKAILILIVITYTQLSAFAQIVTTKDSTHVEDKRENNVLTGRKIVYKQLSEWYLLDRRRLSYHSKLFFTERSLQRLLELIEFRWTEKEKQVVAIQYIEEKIDRDVKNLTKILKDTINHKIWRKERERYKSILDSLLLFESNRGNILSEYTKEIEEVKSRLDNQKLSNELIFTSGMLDDKRFVPVLKKALEDSVHYDPFAVKMALARYGIEPYKNEMLNLNRVVLNKDNMAAQHYYIKKNLLYLCSQESIFEYSKFLYSTYHETIEADDYVIVSIPSNTVSGLEVIILNSDFKLYLSKIESVPEKVIHNNIDWVIKWMEENYGNYELNRDYYPGF